MEVRLSFHRRRQIRPSLDRSITRQIYNQTDLSVDSVCLIKNPYLKFVPVASGL